MALDETAEIRIARPAAEVAAYMFDPANDPAWIGGISEAEPLGPPPIAAGSRVRRRASFLGRRIDYVMEVVALEPGRRLAMHAVEAPMPMDVTYEVDPAPDGAVARVRVQGDTGGLYRLAGPLVSVQVGRSIDGDVRRLKELLEAEAPERVNGDR
jgi:carbon monoxide dehydrogenase subunit G